VRARARAYRETTRLVRTALLPTFRASGDKGREEAIGPGGTGRNLIAIQAELQFLCIIRSHRASPAGPSFSVASYEYEARTRGGAMKGTMRRCARARGEPRGKKDARGENDRSLAAFFKRFCTLSSRESRRLVAPIPPLPTPTATRLAADAVYTVTITNAAN
jgi:hypothetical protein